MRTIEFGPIAFLRCLALMDAALSWAENVSQFESLLGGRLPKRAERRLKGCYDRNVRGVKRDRNES
jgi:hypothetical protein